MLACNVLIQRRDFPIHFDLNISQGGAVAQLGARVNGIHEVAGSIPASSTKKHCV